MKIRVAVCDDERSQTEYLTAKLSEWAARNDHTCDVLAFPSAEAFLFAYGENKSFDVLLLDIEMKEMNGVELARRIREENETVQIIFITGYSDYMSQGYDVGALHYILKPISKEKLFQVLDRAAANLRKAEKRLTVSVNRQTEYIPLSKIVYLEAQMNYTVVYTKTAEYRVKTPLSDLEKKLDDGFFRCQRSFIVNLAEIHTVKRDSVILKNGRSVPISRGMREQIGRAIIERL